MKKVDKYLPGLRLVLIALSLTLFAEHAVSATLIDDFSDFQAVDNGSDGPVAIVGSDLNGITRTLTATPFSNGDTSEVVVEAGLLTVSNGPSGGIASVFYSFDTIDLASLAGAFTFATEFMDLSHQVQLIANGSSIFGFTDLGLGQHVIAFTQFSDPGVFSNLNSLELKFQGRDAWDAQFKLLATSNNTVPEPPVVALLAIGLLATSFRSPKKSVALQAMKRESISV
ncbi:hypothetical protein ACH518_20305 [Methylomonas sp. HW2-6]|uniref:hypothetical protein n=1 Tax=Methylomonas sp. HW2-6 TaxID=3376687 RepID=UPI004042615E